MIPPFQYPLTEPIRVDEQDYSAGEIVEGLKPLLSNNRIQRVEEVLASRSFSICTVLEGLYDRGNISAVMRSAEAYGYASVHIIELDEKFKVANRVSKGAEKWVSSRRWQDTGECLSWLKGRGYQIAATALDTKVEIDQVDFSVPTAVIFGNEDKGISEKVRNEADVIFRVPMHGFTESFNISVAAALCFSRIYELRFRKGIAGDLTPDEKERMRAHYYLRSVFRPEDILERLRSERGGKPAR